MDKTASPAPDTLLTIPWVGSLFTVLSGLTFLLTCMFLPLVGKAAQKVVHANENYRTFLGVLLLSMACSGVATLSKLSRRRIDNSPLPLFSLVLLACCALLLIALLTGLLAI